MKFRKALMKDIWELLSSLETTSTGIAIGLAVTLGFSFCCFF